MSAATPLPDTPAGANGSIESSREIVIPNEQSATDAPGEMAVKEENDFVASLSKEEEDRLLQEFWGEVKEADRFNQVNRVLSCFKLNPFELLDLKLDADRDSIRRQYRKISLMVHPDKCTHPKASDVFDRLGQAHKDLQDDDKWNELQYVFRYAREELRKDRKKSTKNDAAHRLASAIHEDGREGVEAVYETTDEFHEAWVKKSREVIMNAAWRKQKLGKRMKEEQLRLEESEAEMKKRLKSDRDHHKNWEASRDTRVGTWRDFAKGNKSKKGKNLNLGGLRPPKLKMEDEDKTYIQRPVGEQYRPPPPVAARPRNETKNKK